jgi:hypothetical protein
MSERISVVDYATRGGGSSGGTARLTAVHEITRENDIVRGDGMKRTTASGAVARSRRSSGSWNFAVSSAGAVSEHVLRPCSSHDDFACRLSGHDAPAIAEQQQPFGLAAIGAIVATIRMINDAAAARTRAF